MLAKSTAIPHGKKAHGVQLADAAEAFLKATFDRIPWGKGTHKGKWNQVDADKFRQKAAKHIEVLKIAVLGP